MMGWIQAVAAGWLEWMIAASWQVALLVAVLAALDVAVGRRAWPQLRHALWMLVAVKLVLPPGLPSLFRPPEITGSSPSALADAGPAPWVAWILLAWASGAVIVASSAIQRSLRVRRELSADAGPVPPELQVIAARVASRLGLRRPVALRITGSGAGPLVLGLMHPTVFVPRRVVVRWSPQALEHVLCHEIAHVRRRDLWLEAAFAVLAAVYWFHPGVHWARRQAHALREMCCDATAAACAGPGYRSTLVRISADELLGAAGATALGGRRSWILARLRALDRRSAAGSLGRRLVTYSVVLVAALALLPMAARQAGPDLEVQLAEARWTLARTMTDAPENGSLHVRYAVMQLSALEMQRTGGLELPGTPLEPNETD